MYSSHGYLVALEYTRVDDLSKRLGMEHTHVITLPLGCAVGVGLGGFFRSADEIHWKQIPIVYKVLQYSSKVESNRFETM
jgi:hypothetical protein